MMNPDEDDALRRAFAHDPSRSNLKDPVDADTLWDAVRGEAGPDAVASLADRMATDATLAEDWRLASEFSAALDEELISDREEPEVPPTMVVVAESAANHGDYLRWGAALAVVAAAVLLVLAWPRGGVSSYDPGQGQMRGAGGAIEAVRGEGAVAVDASAIVLEWSEVPGAVRYELHVSTTDLQSRLQELDVQTTSMTLPPEVLRDLPEGAELLWRVEAVLGDDARVISETFALSIQ